MRRGCSTSMCRRRNPARRSRRSLLLCRRNERSARRSIAGRTAGMSASAVKDDLGEVVSAFCAHAEEALARAEPDRVPDQELQRVMTAAVKLYAAKSEYRAQELAPFGDRPVNATEAVTAICAFMRAADLNFFDLQMWYRRGERE